MNIILKEHSTLNPGLIKYIIQLDDKNVIESVFLPFEKTLCISSQVGCNVKCGFCVTGSEKFVRNLKSIEIIEQYNLIQQDLINNDNNLKIKTISLMGMGEPLLNYNNVCNAIKEIKQNNGYMEFYLSTSGIVPKIFELSKSLLPVDLYVSLHASNDKVRQQIIKKSPYNIDDILKACKYWSENNKQRMLNFFYLLLDDINDKPEHAYELVQLLNSYGLGDKRVFVKIYCDAELPGFRKSTKTSLYTFLNILEKNNICVSIAPSSGLDVQGGCGQLRQHHASIDNKVI